MAIFTLKSLVTESLFIIEVSWVMSMTLTLWSLRNDKAEIRKTGRTESFTIRNFKKLFLQPTQRKEDKEERSKRGKEKINAKF
jgi:hypothetical protein